MSSISFRVLSLITFLAVIISIPTAVLVVEKLFPAYTSGIKVLILLLLATTLPFPIGSLTNFIIAAKKSLRPFLMLSLLNGGLVLLTSFLLIPRIMGGAISQAIVSTISSSFVLVYALRTSTFILGRRETTLLAVMPLIGIYEVFIDPLYLDLLLLLSILFLFEFFEIITVDDMKLIQSFLPSKLKFVALILKIIS